MMTIFDVCFYNCSEIEDENEDSYEDDIIYQIELEVDSRDEQNLLMWENLAAKLIKQCGFYIVPDCITFSSRVSATFIHAYYNHEEGRYIVDKASWS